jgi:amino acid transporter
MAAKPGHRAMISERIAPGMLPRVLSSFDMTIIFVAIVLFIVNASAVQPAGQSAFAYWILGFLASLIPGALVTAQLGLIFPQEGSLYVWTQKALGPFWGFFAGFCAWWPGILVMVASAFGAYVTFRSAWTPLLSVGHWRMWLGVLTGVSVLAAVLIYGIREYTRRRELPTPTPTPAG